MQLIGQILEHITADVVACMAVVAGLAALSILRRNRKHRQTTVALAAAAPQLQPGSDWRKIMDVSLTELESAPDLRSMQAHAALQIDAAEHAFNRLLAECAKVGSSAVAPTFAPLRQLPDATEPPAPQRRQPLAA